MVIIMRPFPIEQMNNICPGYEYYTRNYCPGQFRISNGELNLTNHMRMLWEQHITWTRMVIQDIVQDSQNLDVDTNRLLKNPMDFELALRPLYGGVISSQFRDLLKSHLVIAAQLVKYAKAGNNKAAADTERKWYLNADEIASFLGHINPYWSEAAWKTMMHEHLALTKAEAVDVITKNYAESVPLYDNIEKQALKMADMMAEGIIKQFPTKFS
jgi:hypothetical protein